MINIKEKVKHSRGQRMPAGKSSLLLKQIEGSVFDKWVLEFLASFHEQPISTVKEGLHFLQTVHVVK